jgi:hypothetical protein
MNLSLAPQPWMRIFLTILVALLLTYTCGRNAQSSAAEALAPTPQFVSITFDDNFGLAAPDAVGGVRAVTEFFAGKHNPTGTGNEAVFDGTPISTTFFKMCVYMVDRSGKVIGGYRGEDWKGRNRSAWKAAFAAGNEMADHTVNHFNGGTAPINQDDCCRARDWDLTHWTNEIGAARRLMNDRQYGLGAKNVIGFRGHSPSGVRHGSSGWWTLEIAGAHV